MNNKKKLNNNNDSQTKYSSQPQRGLGSQRHNTQSYVQQNNRIINLIQNTNWTQNKTKYNLSEVGLLPGNPPSNVQPLTRTRRILHRGADAGMQINTTKWNLKYTVQTGLSHLHTGPPTPHRSSRLRPSSSYGWLATAEGTFLPRKPKQSR